MKFGELRFKQEKPTPRGAGRRSFEKIDPDRPLQGYNTNVHSHAWPDDALTAIEMPSAKPNTEEHDSMRTFRLIGGIAAFLAVLGLAILLFWLMVRLPRF